MKAAILGKKIGMTQVYDETGALHPVTVVQAGPCAVLQVKTADTDGYNAIQLGFGEVKASRAKRPAIGHCAKAGQGPWHFVREVRQDEPEAELEVGGEVTVELFDDVTWVDVTGTSKGKGYAGGVKRHGFKGQLATHGVKRRHRSPGSIGGHANNAGKSGKIKKGKRMAGHMGVDRVTGRNLRVMGVDKESNLLLIKGTIAGPSGGYVLVRKSKTKQ